MTCRVRSWRLGPLGRSNRRRRRSFSREFDATNEAKRDGGVTRASFAATLLRKFDVTLAPPQLEALWRQYVPFFVSLMFSHFSGGSGSPRALRRVLLAPAVPRVAGVRRGGGSKTREERRGVVVSPVSLRVLSQALLSRRSRGSSLAAGVTYCITYCNTTLSRGQVRARHAGGRAARDEPLRAREPAARLGTRLPPHAQVGERAARGRRRGAGDARPHAGDVTCDAT